jgi:hypothetical protein
MDLGSMSVLIEPTSNISRCHRSLPAPPRHVNSPRPGCVWGTGNVRSGCVYSARPTFPCQGSLRCLSLSIGVDWFPGHRYFSRGWAQKKQNSTEIHPPRHHSIGFPLSNETKSHNIKLQPLSRRHIGKEVRAQFRNPNRTNYGPWSHGPQRDQYLDSLLLGTGLL